MSNLATLVAKSNNPVYQIIASEAEAPKAPSLRKGAPSTVTWEKEQHSKSFNIDFSNNYIRRKNPSFLM